MIQFFKKYKSGTGKSENEKLAFEYLVTDTLDKNLKGPSKSKQVTGLDMETSIGTSIMPTLIYTFKYNSEHVDKEGKFEFRDYVPVVFCMGVKDNFMYGINFNLIPNDARAALLDAIQSTNKEFYESTAYNEGTNFNSNLVQAIINDEGRKQFLNALDQVVGIPVSRAYRMYNIDCIENIRLIEYDVWEYIPYLVFKDAIRGANLAALQAEMISK